MAWVSVNSLLMLSELLAIFCGVILGSNIEVVTTVLDKDNVQQLLAHTPPEHVEYTSLQSVVKVLEQLEKMVHEEVSSASNIRQTLEIERRIVGGCPALLDKEQVLVREGLNNEFVLFAMFTIRCSQAGEH